MDIGNDTLSPQVLLIFRSADLKIIDQAKSLRIPTGLFFLAAYLNENGICTVVENFSALTTEEQIQRLKRHNPAYVGLSMFTINRTATLETASMVKRTLPGVKVVVGGPHAGVVSGLILERQPDIDCVVCGEGEETLLTLVQCWEKEQEPYKVTGIYFRKGGEIINTPARPPISDLAMLPHPAKYFAYHDISSSRGCPYTCQFCSSSRFWGKSIRFHPAEWVLEEIEYLYRYHGIRELSIADDVFTLDRDRTIAICKGILERKLHVRFRCMSRVNTLCPDRIEWLKKAGCYQIDFGVESGSERQLKAMGKKAGARQAIRAFQMTREAGIETGCFLIVGYPGENDKSIADTCRLLKKLRPDWSDLSSMAIFPGSPIHRRLQAEGKLREDIWFTMTDHTLFLVEDGNRKRHLRYLADLKRAYEKSRPGTTERIARKRAIFTRYPDLGHAGLELARLLAETGNPEAGLSVLDRVAGKEPQNPFLWHEMGQLHLQRNDPEAALSAVERALNCQPNNYDSLRLLANISARLGDFQTATDIYQGVISVRPEKIEARIDLGDLFKRLGMYPEAITTYKEAMKIDPYWPPLLAAVEQCEVKMTAA